MKRVFVVAMAVFGACNNFDQLAADARCRTDASFCDGGIGGGVGGGATGGGVTGGGVGGGATGGGVTGGGVGGGAAGGGVGGATGGGAMDAGSPGGGTGGAIDAGSPGGGVGGGSTGGGVGGAGGGMPRIDAGTLPHDGGFFTAPIVHTLPGSSYGPLGTFGASAVWVTSVGFGLTADAGVRMTLPDGGLKFLAHVPLGPFGVVEQSPEVVLLLGQPASGSANNNAFGVWRDGGLQGGSYLTATGMYFPAAGLAYLDVGVPSLAIFGQSSSNPISRSKIAVSSVLGTLQLNIAETLPCGPSTFSVTPGATNGQYYLVVPNSTGCPAGAYLGNATTPSFSRFADAGAVAVSSAGVFALLSNIDGGMQLARKDMAGFVSPSPDNFVIGIGPHLAASADDVFLVMYQNSLIDLRIGAHIVNLGTEQHTVIAQYDAQTLALKRFGVLNLGSGNYPSDAVFVGGKLWVAGSATLSSPNTGAYLIGIDP